MFGVYWNTMERRICDVWDEKDWWKYFSEQYLIKKKHVASNDAKMWGARWYYGIRDIFLDTCAKMKGEGADRESRDRDEETQHGNVDPEWQYEEKLRRPRVSPHPPMS